MACCVFTAYVMNRLIKICEVLDFNLIDIKYNDFDDGDDYETEICLPKTLITSKLDVEGMTCTACVSAIEKTLSALCGVHATSVSLALSRVSIIHDETIIQAPELETAVQRIGYGASAERRLGGRDIDVVEHKARLQALRSSFSNAATISSLIVMVNSSASYVPLFGKVTSATFCLITTLAVWVQLWTARDIHRSAWRKSSFYQPSMDMLISLSISLGLIMSALSVLEQRLPSATTYLSSGSFLVTVVLGGRYIQTLLERQTAKSLAELLSLQAKISMVQLQHRSSHESPMIPALALQPGHEIVLPPRSIVPCDCYIISGKGMLDEASMTGESLPKAVGIGDGLMSGTRLLASNVVAIVSRSQEESALERLISSISTATEVRHGSNAIDLLSAYFVQMIVLLALYAFTRAFLCGPENYTSLSVIRVAGEKAMAVLACACPCALGLATPSAVLSGVSVAWSKGILFTGGLNAIRKLAHVTHVVMDKTGTLTTGKLAVSKVHAPIKDWQYMLICSAESGEAQAHPVARALFRWALSQLTEEQRSEQNRIAKLKHQNELGKGVSSVLSMNGQTFEVQIGTAAFLQECGVQQNALILIEKEHAIVVNIAIDGRHISSLSLQDTLRPESQAVINILRDKEALTITMLTGDTQQEADRITAMLGIPVASSRALPEAKQAFIQGIQSSSPKNQVMMVGDGMNDGPALSRADVGILISPGLSRLNGSCVQAADVILTGASLHGLVEAILIAKMTERQILFNVAWALLYNVCAVTVAMGGVESWGLAVDASMAGTLMAGSSVSVVALSLALRYRLQSVRFAGPDSSWSSRKDTNTY